MNTPHIHLFVVDPQNDFCDLPPDYCPQTDGTPCAPALPVTGAHEDMLRLGQLIRRASKQISAITISLDSHHHIDIGHPTFWQYADGRAVPPFTKVNAVDVEQGQLLPLRPANRDRVLRYLRQLEARGRYTHMIWPVHCEIGSWGHNVHPDVRSAYNYWEEKTLSSVVFVHKGEYPMTEHYSAFCAEVPDDRISSTQFNQPLVNQLRKADQIWIAGEAASHCVKSTVEHLAEELSPQEQSKIVLLTDCMSPVTGFEAQFHDFLQAMHARGVRVVKTDDVLE